VAAAMDKISRHKGPHRLSSRTRFFPLSVSFVFPSIWRHNIFSPLFPLSSAALIDVSLACTSTRQLFPSKPDHELSLLS